MRPLALALLLLLASLAPAAPPKEGGAVELLKEAIAALESRALGRERVDWRALERELVATLRADRPAADAHSAIGQAVAKLGDPHARFVPAAPPTPPSDAAQQPPQPQRPAIPTLPTGRLLDDRIAYLLVPGCAAPDVDGLRAYARRARAEIARLAAQSPKGWLVDLRLNGGGNLWPMLLGLHPLLGDGAAMATVVGTEIESRYGVDASGAWIDWGRGPEVQLAWGDDAPAALATIDAPLAVLLGPWTMSSGEALAICLEERGKAGTFGERTSGLTTVTTYAPLADGSMLILPVSRMARLDGRAFLGAIEPDRTVAFGEWPAHDDAAAVAARAWLLERATPARAAPTSE